MSQQSKDFLQTSESMPLSPKTPFPKTSTLISFAISLKPTMSYVAASPASSLSYLLLNYFNGLHGGAVGAIAERVSIACARTVVAGDKELFLGELSISYLSAATLNEVLVVEATVARSGRNLTVVASEFRIKKTRKLVYTSRATFYHMPLAKL
ncbi:hypothetical protein SADUNF_Sadunf02G0130000 [Salix dunnii]|uniref:Thioesterase domain-containing protein n=1 Tax=Salix dunnii TaxID=1413687 RepID=A0A835N7H5_9ROSI|nr:hypothetical protein SADUNF_Sadunf02G0130000 [Salix dunnii]